MKLFDWLFAARPMLHLPVWSIYLVSLRYHHRLSGDTFDAGDLLMLGCLTLLTAGAYFINQVHDVDTDRVNDKLGFIGGGYLSCSSMTLAWLACSVVPLMISLFWSVFVAFLFAQLMFLGWLYSVPPARFKDRPFGGLLANAWSFGFLIPFTIMPDMTLNNTGLLGWDNPFYFFFAVAAVHLLTTLPDRLGDKIANKRTLGVIWPSWLVRATAMLFLALAGWFAWRSGHDLLLYVALLSLLAATVALLVRTEQLDLLATKLPILLLSLLAAFWYPIYGLFLVVLLLATRLYYRKRFNLIYPRLS